MSDTGDTSDNDDRYQRVNLRIPKDLHIKLMAAAGRRSRSMNAEIVARLEVSFESVEDRLAALEEEVFDPKLTLEEVRGSIRLIEKDIENLRSNLYDTMRHMR